jgi:hypothetical protein
MLKFTTSCPADAGFNVVIRIMFNLRTERAGINLELGKTHQFLNLIRVSKTK